MYYKNLYKRDVTRSWHPLPLSQTVTPSRTPSPSSVTYFMDGPLLVSRAFTFVIYFNWNTWHITYESQFSISWTTIHSFVYFYSASSSPLSTTTQRSSDYSIDTFLELIHQALQTTVNEALPNVSTWRLEWALNLRPSGHKASNLPLSRHASPSLVCFLCPFIEIYFQSRQSGLRASNAVENIQGVAIWPFGDPGDWRELASASAAAAANECIGFMGCNCRWKERQRRKFQ